MNDGRKKERGRSSLNRDAEQKTERSSTEGNCQKGSSGEVGTGHVCVETEDGEMNDTQYYTLIAVPLVGILMNGALFIYLGGRIDKLIEKFNDLAVRVTKIEARLGIGP